MKIKFSLLLFVFLLVIPPSVFAQSESQFSFNLHAPYNFGGTLYPGDNVINENFYAFMDGKISSIGGINIIRNSGRTGINPKLIPDMTKCPAGDNPPCFSSTEPSRPWSYPEAVVRHIKDSGKEVMMEITLLEEYNGRYIRDRADVNNLLSLTDEALRRFGSTVKYWQIGNEPGVDKWSTSETTRVNGESVLLLAYATVEASKKIKTACPGCKVVLAGIGFYGPSAIEYYHRLIDDIDYLETLGGTNSFDVFDFHHHENFAGDTYLKTKEKYTAIRSLLDNHHRSNIPIWITELSAYSGQPRNYTSRTEDKQAGEMIKRFLYAYYSGVKKVFWSPSIIDTMYGGDPNSYFSFVGLFNKDATTPKISFRTMNMLTTKFNGFTSVTKIDMGNTDTYLLKFIFYTASGKTPVYAIWKENGETSVNLSSVIGNNIIVTKHDTMVTAETANQVTINEFPKIIEMRPVAPTPSPTPTTAPCIDGNLGNINCDAGGKINQLDQNLLQSAWTRTGPPPAPLSGQRNADLNNDTIVDEKDLTIMLKNWKP